MNDHKIKICLKTVNNASLFVAKCGEYKDWDINYIHGRLVLDAKSLMGVLSVAIDAPAYVEILTDDEKVLDNFNIYRYNYLVFRNKEIIKNIE